MVSVFTSAIRSSLPEMFLGKVILKICSKSTGEHPCQSVISIELLTQLTITCSKPTIETLNKGVKYVQS